MCCADLRNRKGRAVAGRATDGRARLRTCRYGVSALVCVAALDSRRLRQAPPSRGRVDVQGVAATASEPSQHLLPATDRGPQGRLAFGRQRARGGRGRQGSSTGPTPDAVDATRRLVSPDRAARRRRRGGQRLERYNARRRSSQHKKPRSLRPAGRCISSQTPRSCR